MPTTMATARPTTTSTIRCRCTASTRTSTSSAMTFNPEGFADMKEKYFLLNGRSYPTRSTRSVADTVGRRCLSLLAAAADDHQDRPRPAGAATDLESECVGVPDAGSLGVPMQVVGYNAKLLRDQAGNTCTTRPTRSPRWRGIAGRDPGQLCRSLGANGPVLLVHDPDGRRAPTNLYTPNLDHLSNDAETSAARMTEVRVAL